MSCYNNNNNNNNDNNNDNNKTIYKAPCYVLIYVIFATGDVKRNSENRLSVLETKSGLHLPQTKFELIFLSFSSTKLHTNYQMSDKINSHICLMLSVLKVFTKRSIWPAKKPYITRFNWA